MADQPSLLGQLRAELNPTLLTDLEIHELRDDGQLTLRLTGELDISSTPVLRDRVEKLQGETRRVRLNLSRLEFIDSSGIHLLVAAFGDARANGWEFDLDPNLSPQVERLVDLTNLRLRVGDRSMVRN